jgi:hypothetical protein
MKWFILFCLLLFVYIASHAQTNCNVSLTSNCNPTGAGSQCIISGEPTINFTFESFGDFLTGGNVFGASILKMIVGENVAPAADCRWRLNIHMDNNGGGGSANRWEQVYAYGTNTAPQPSVGILEMRIRNLCNTSKTGNSYSTLASTADDIAVVESPTESNEGGLCLGDNVNRPGSYLNNYGEYSFAIDYRIQPTLNVQPGIYRLNVKFCVTEGN